MCGIAGLLYLDGRPAEREILDPMTRVLAHRGPDGQDIYTDGPLGLGQRRLSIVDLSENGKQPMSNEDGAVWITYNGEIYNHLPLRADLLEKGHRFRSQTDTESIIHGYEEYGEEVLHRLNGMFAFALWDGRARSLWLVRDRLGVKPLFYAQFGPAFLFGSEIKAILAHPAAQRELDLEALDLYLSLNYTPAPHTLFKGIRQLEPGQSLRLSLDDPHPRLKNYWDVNYHEQLELSEAEATAQFAELLEAAVQRRLMADVPLGAFLSGGLDSSAVAACMKQVAGEQVKTFSIGFGEASYNEAPYARQVAQHLGTQHHEQTVTPDLAGVLPKIVWHGEDPLADSSMIPVYYLSQMTRQHVTVALAGDGADEILAGYPTYQATLWARRLQFLPHPLVQSFSGALLRHLPLSDEKISWQEKLARFMAGLGLPWGEAHAVWRQIHSPAQKRALLQSSAQRPHRLPGLYQNYYDRSGAKNILDALLYADTRFYLPNDMLVKVDRMTMAHSLEGRVPFLDYTLVEFAAKLPPSYKLRGGVGKYLLRRAMAERLPEVTLKRPKAGFNIPAAKWLRGDLRDLLHSSLAPERLNAVGIWQTGAIQTMLADHQARRADYGHQLWGLLTFMLWWDQFMTA